MGCINTVCALLPCEDVNPPPGAQEKDEQMYRLVGHSSAVTCVKQLSGGRVVTGSQDNSLRIWSLFSGEEMTCFRPSKYDSDDEDDEGDGEQDGGGGGSGGGGDGAKHASKKGHEGDVLCLDVEPGSDLIVSGEEVAQSGLRVWRESAGGWQGERELRQARGRVIGVAIVRGGRRCTSRWS